MPLDRSRPLWHAYLIHGYGDGAAMICRMHHCIADGIALARVMLSLTDAAPDVELATPPADQDRRNGGGASLTDSVREASPTSITAGSRCLAARAAPVDRLVHTMPAIGVAVLA